MLSFQLENSLEFAAPHVTSSIVLVKTSIASSPSVVHELAKKISLHICDLGYTTRAERKSATEGFSSRERMTLPMMPNTLEEKID